MPLRRSESTRTTFSVYVTRKTKYQRYLGIINVLLLLGCLNIMFFGMVLKLSYYMDQLDFITPLFKILPLSLIGVGVCTFLLSSLGFIFSASEDRPLLLAYGGLTAALALAQIGTVFAAMLVRSSIVSSALKTKSGSAILDYETNHGTRDKWDYLQTNLRCCGPYGFRDYFSLPNSEHFKCVPKTCCFGAKLGETEGRNLLGGSVAVSSATGRCNWGTGDACPQEVVLSQSIYVRGCLDILSEMYSSDLVNLLLLYGLGGTVFVLIELVAVALAFAYAAQLNGRKKREMEWSPGEDLTGGGGGGMHHHSNNDPGVAMDQFGSGDSN